MNKSEKNHAKHHCSHKTLNLDNSSKNTKFKKIFLISNHMLDGLFNDTTHISESGIIKKPYYHKWYPTHTNIGRPKLSEQNHLII